MPKPYFQVTKLQCTGGVVAPALAKVARKAITALRQPPVQAVTNNFLQSKLLSQGRWKREK